MYVCQLLTLDGKTIAEKISTYLSDDKDGGYFDMPNPKIRPGQYILRCLGEADRPIDVHATSHKAAHFRFTK
jgi:hypothetical protein